MLVLACCRCLDTGVRIEKQVEMALKRNVGKVAGSVFIRKRASSQENMARRDAQEIRVALKMGGRPLRLIREHRHNGDVAQNVTKPSEQGPFPVIKCIVKVFQIQLCDPSYRTKNIVSNIRLLTRHVLVANRRWLLSARRLVKVDGPVQPERRHACSGLRLLPVARPEVLDQRHRHTEPPVARLVVLRSRNRHPLDRQKFFEGMNSRLAIFRIST